MHFKVALAQTCHPGDFDVVSLVRRFASEAAAGGACLVVFPESLMSRYEEEIGDFLAQSQSIEGEFPKAVDAIAREYGIWIIYTMNERNPAGGKPFNTAVITDSKGCKRGVYRKIHLFDSATTHESERMSAGSELLAPVETPMGHIGIGICYDLRFPELARAAALRRCDMMVYPSAWVDGPGKQYQWEHLLVARAIENECYVAGVCRADEGYVGTSMLVAPDGAIVAKAGASEELLVADIDLDRVSSVRKSIPVFDHRRCDVYGHSGFSG